MKKLFLISAVLLTLSLINLQAQQPDFPKPPCYEHPGLSFKFPLPPASPEYTTDMPLDVLVGYIALDSLLRSDIASIALANFFGRATYANDTTWQLAKYLYKLRDYDPVKFRRYEGCLLSQGYPLVVARLFVDRITSLGKNLADSTLIYALNQSAIIAHISVNETYYYTSPGYGQLADGKIIKATIIDPIKGKVIPACVTPIEPQSAGGNNTNQTYYPAQHYQTATVGSCLQFEYSPAWLRYSGPSDTPYLCDESQVDTSFIVKKDREYIAFLSFTGLCSDSLNEYVRLYPVGNPLNAEFWSQSIRPIMVFPVENGKVVDRGCQLGLGSNLTPTEFKAELRSRINNLLSGQPPKTQQKDDNGKATNKVKMSLTKKER